MLFSALGLYFYFYFNFIVLIVQNMPSRIKILLYNCIIPSSFFLYSTSKSKKHNMETGKKTYCRAGTGAVQGA